MLKVEAYFGAPHAVIDGQLAHSVGPACGTYSFYLEAALHGVGELRTWVANAGAIVFGDNLIALLPQQGSSQS